MLHLLPAPYRREADANLRLAAPLIAAQISFIGMGVMDTIMAGHLGERELAAIAVGANIWMQAFVLFMGVCMACSPIIAQRQGAGEAASRSGEFVRGALLLAFGLGLLWWVLIQWLAWPLIDVLGLAPQTAALAHQYLLAESYGAPLLMLCFVLRSSAEGLGLARVVLAAGISTLSAKALFNLGFVYGHAGFPRLGAVGFGWATVCASCVMLAVYVLHYAWLPALRALRVARRGWPRVDAQSFEMLRLGLPIGVVLLAEVAFFGSMALLMARFGDAAVAAHQIALNFTSLTFMVPLSIGLAATVRVGHAAGAGDRPLMRTAGVTAMLLGLGYALCSAALMALAPQHIVALYTDAPAVAHMSQGFLLFAALFQGFDCLQSTASGALRGLKDTQAPMAITLVAYWVIGMPAAAWLALRAGMGPQGLWAGLIVGLCAAAAGLSLRFLRRTRV